MGKKRVAITNIQQDTKVKLLDVRQPLNESLWSAVFIHGDPSYVKTAYTTISTMLESEF